MIILTGHIGFCQGRVKKGKHMESVNIIYFSGTGGTEKYAEGFRSEFGNRGVTVFVNNLGEGYEKRGFGTVADLSFSDLNILLFPVYVFDAPKLVHDWIKSIVPEQVGNKIAVLSVAGGGDMLANVSCRKACCNILEGKGFNVVYDGMLVMPANVFIKYSDDLIMHLVNAIPRKVNEIVNYLMEGKVIRTSFRKGIFSKLLFKIAQKNFHKFAKSYKVTDACNLCGWCVDNCPKNNILVNDTLEKVVFKDDCAVCLRCIYGCPMKAITLKGVFVLKSGYDLNDVINRMKGVDLIPVEECCKGYIYNGVKKYLLN